MTGLEMEAAKTALGGEQGVRSLASLALRAVLLIDGPALGLLMSGNEGRNSSQ